MTGQALDNGELNDLYRELVLDHARNPRHFGRLDRATHKAEGINPLCGDKLKMYFCIDNDGRIEATSFEGSGCAISVASASLLTDTVVGMSVESAEALFASVTARLTQRTADQDVAVCNDFDEPLAKLRALDGVREYPSRVKCATLAWHALHSALNHRAGPASTE